MNKQTKQVLYYLENDNFLIRIYQKYKNSRVIYNSFILEDSRYPVASDKNINFDWIDSFILGK